MTSPHALTTRRAFGRSVQVEVDIDASAGIVWGLLTDAAGFPSWNTTVTSIEGPISLGTKLRIRVPVSERTFTPNVTEFQPESAMTWADGQMPFFKGVRTFALAPQADGVRFSMIETFRGVMVPLVARSLPDFGPIFEQYAADLKAAAERIAQEVR